MHRIASFKHGDLPHGAFVIGRAVGDFKINTGISPKNCRPYRYIGGQVLAGGLFVKISQFLKPCDVPFLPHDGDEVLASIIPDHKAGGVLVVMAELAYVGSHAQEGKSLP